MTKNVLFFILGAAFASLWWAAAICGIPQVIALAVLASIGAGVFIALETYDNW